VPAVKGVTFTVEPGEVHSLLGENGAGKSTLMKMAAGAVAPSEGQILIDGKEISFANPAAALHAGIAMVYQETSLIPSMTVAQNVFLGNERFFNRVRGLNIAAQQLLNSLNFPVDPHKDVAALGAGQKQMVEIARSLQFGARVIVFDEPTATLTPEEKHHFFGLIQRLRERGISIVFISHALEEALAISDRITILRDGSHVITAHASELDRDAIVRHMVGRSLAAGLYDKRRAEDARPAGPQVLSVENLSMGGIVRNNSFSVYAGQITGMFGLVGSGRTETAKVLAGIAKRDIFHGGEIRRGDRYARYRVPRPAVLDGIGYVTEDRKIEGFFEVGSIAENIYAGTLVTREGGTALTSRSKMREIARKWISKLHIRAINDDARVIELSGGNQQKVVIAKTLVQSPEIIIFDEPTRGVDVGAIAEIHKIIHDLADSGVAVIVISSYLPEVLALSDRLLVFKQGRVVEELRAGEADERKVMFAAVH
jgi:simple sugar transport system ATP-binding protein